MRYLVVIVLTVALAAFTPLAAYGLYTSGVSEGHGVITLRQIDDIGWVAGGEYGIAGDWGVALDIGEKDYNRGAVKLQLNPDLSLLLGVTGSKMFLGINPSVELTDNITGLSEFDIYYLDSKLALDYELGIRFGLTQKLDIRAGILGTATESNTTNRFQLGLGYQF